MDKPKVLALILLAVLGSLLVVSHSLGQEDDEAESINGDQVDYTAEINFTQAEELDIKTEYLAVNGMRGFDSESLSVESDSCLRFTGYEGLIQFQDYVKLDGAASGFSTCDLNATTSFNLEEETDPERLFTTNQEEHGDLHFDDVNLSLTFRNYDLSFRGQEGSLEEENVSIKLGGFEGSFNYIHPGTLELNGESKISIEDDNFTY